MLGHEEFKDAFVEDLEPIYPSYSSIVEFVEYLIENYIDNNSKFPLDM